MKKMLFCAGMLALGLSFNVKADHKIVNDTPYALRIKMDLNIGRDYSRNLQPGQTYNFKVGSVKAVKIYYKNIKIQTQDVKKIGEDFVIREIPRLNVKSLKDKEVSKYSNSAKKNQAKRVLKAKMAQREISILKGALQKLNVKEKEIEEPEEEVVEEKEIVEIVEEE